MAAAAAVTLVAILGISIFLALGGGSAKTRLMLELLRLMFPYMLLVCLAAVFIGMANARGHFFEDHSNEITYEASRYAASLDPSYRMYLIGAPMTYVVFGNFKYLLPDRDVEMFPRFSCDPLVSIRRIRGMGREL